MWMSYCNYRYVYDCWRHKPDTSAGALPCYNARVYPECGTIKCGTRQSLFALLLCNGVTHITGSSGVGLVSVFQVPTGLPKLGDGVQEVMGGRQFGREDSEAPILPRTFGLDRSAPCMSPQVLDTNHLNPSLQPKSLLRATVLTGHLAHRREYVCWVLAVKTKICAGILWVLMVMTLLHHCGRRPQQV
jgi:hypothetical protein